MKAEDFTDKPLVSLKDCAFLVDPTNWDRAELLERMDVEATEAFWKRVGSLHLGDFENESTH